MNINKNFSNLKENYLFAEIDTRVKKYASNNPDKKLIRLGIGDVTLPLGKTVTAAMTKAVAEMGEKSTFRGYGPYEGYAFLREAISGYYKKTRSLDIAANEIYVSEGAKSDVGNIVDIFGSNTVLIPDPVYPVYLDSNIMAGSKIEFLPSNEDNGFLPLPSQICKDVLPDIIYLCSPNNPTGAVYSFEQLKEWVDYACERNALILFDAAYEGYISGNYPHSIFEIDGARKCAIEFCSFSKTAGFTGTRCAYTIIPSELTFDGVNMGKLWLRRQSTKYNGVSYIIQRGAEAALSEQGQAEIAKTVGYYMNNAAVIAKALKEKGIWFTGGVNSPYIWFKCPGAMASWDFFDTLLEKANVVGTPGSGFGTCGEGFFRLTSFGDADNTVEAVKRITAIL